MSNNGNETPKILKKLNEITASSVIQARKLYRSAILRTFHDWVIHNSIYNEPSAYSHQFRDEEHASELVATTLAELLETGAREVTNYVASLETTVAQLKKENETLLKAKTVSELPQAVVDFVATVQALDESDMEAKEVRRGVRKLQRDAETIFPVLSSQEVRAVTYED